MYHKDDLWVISTSDTGFDSLASGTDDITFIAKAIYHGPSQGGKLEIEPFGNKPSLLNRLKSKIGPGRSVIVNAMRLINAGTVISMLENFEHLDSEEGHPLPILPLLLGNFSMNADGSMRITKPTRSIHSSSGGAPAEPKVTDIFPLQSAESVIEELIEETVSEHHLNSDQAAVPHYSPLRSLLHPSTYIQNPDGSCLKLCLEPRILQVFRIEQPHSSLTCCLHLP